MGKRSFAVTEDEGNEEIDLAATQLLPTSAQHGALMLPVSDIALDPVTDIRSGAESEESLREFAARIDLEGLAQPILVRPRQVGYSIIAGRRRLAAFKLNGQTHIPAYVLDVDDETARKLAFEENFRRKQFSPKDLALLFIESRDKLGKDVPKNWSERVSAKFGVSRATVTEHVKMYEALADEPNLLEKVHSGELSASAAMGIAGEKADSAKLFEEAQKLAVQEAAERASKPPKIAKGSPRTNQGGVDPQAKAEKSVRKAAEGKDVPNKPIKVQAKHVKQALRSKGKSAGALNRAEIVDELAKLANKPGYPPVMSAFLNYVTTDWQAGKGTREVLAQHWLNIACQMDEKTPGCADGGKLPPAVFGSPEVKIPTATAAALKKGGKQKSKAKAKPVAKKAVKKPASKSSKPRTTAPAKNRKKK